MNSGYFESIILMISSKEYLSAHVWKKKSNSPFWIK